ncbi:ribonuclease P protein component [Nitrosomonas halophila]|uniref:Ribonuclease P protein component n=1 Tax=Nitrosomonas halophila TaxID=44576 RepID=A0A1H3BZN5_9PROT|nr:ribonuclease P protein component [Nitrosomonas halophila]SDX47168.1 ribonuclease P protein component [Nitrosomonas halophila]
MFTQPHAYSLPKQQRLRKAIEFRAVLRSRTIFNGTFLRLYVKPTDSDYGRIGLIVAKRVERGAVKRNRVKRILREAFRRNQQAIAGLDCIFQLRHPFSSTDSGRIYQEASMLLLKVK